MKRKKLRKLIRQEIRAVLAEMATPPGRLIGGVLEDRPVYPVGVPFHSIEPYLPRATGPSITTTDTHINQALSELLNITKESVARSGEYSFNVTAWNQLAGEEPNVSC